VFRMAFITDTINWGQLWSGIIPSPGSIFKPAEGFSTMLAALPETSRAFWTDLIVSRQQNIIAAAVSSAVGINMTFLFAYSMLRRKWGAEYQGMMKFDLATGMLIPFMLATSCVIISSASQFHTVPQPGFLEQNEAQWEPPASHAKQYN